MKLPESRADLLIQELSDEVMVYDLRMNKAYCLNETSKIVFSHCDGKTSLELLKNKYRFSDDIIYLALDELKNNNLLKSDYASPFAGMNRREVIKRAGLASMVVLPVITALTAPKSSYAASSSCPVGQLPGDPVGTQGRGDTCGCGNNVGVGNTCGAGTTFAPASTCRTGCTCRATACSAVSDTCIGACE